ncbi:hypothetical protein EZV73_06100 [Acidaminobacter sp. JC074]|uniref:hypothetical protein n=1 Tax=Acidaminobacter sp. JC074 TaxID=2530199 RepID=UPI001F112268|nr:hypothetical protein [Acidaminobacter sp. JC074]MCH4887132.1 hypothetical protein [Acidaminobacter sp. JC074]
MQSQYKNRSLMELYSILEGMLSQDITLRYPMELKNMHQGIAAKICTPSENLTLFFYPGHPVSQFSVIINGMRYIYPKRLLRFKRHHVGDLLKVIGDDDRMRGYSKCIEMYLTAILKEGDLYNIEVKSS